MQVGAFTVLSAWFEDYARWGHLPLQPVLIVAAVVGFVMGMAGLRVTRRDWGALRLAISAVLLEGLLGAAWFFGVVWIALERI